MPSSLHENSQKARRALIHPVWLGALALLIVNDHVLKGSGHLPSLITGKLSDFAGLLVAPALLCALLTLRSPRAWIWAHIATGAVFSAINLFPWAAHAIEALTRLTPFPWHVTVDPSDLMALPSLLLSYHLFFGPKTKTLREMPLAERVLAMTGAVACMATSPAEPAPCTGEFCDQGTAFEQASLVLSNRTDSQRVVRIRPLKSSVSVDCTKMLADPTATLSRELFESAQSWILEPGRAVPLHVPDNCAAYLVDADGMTPKLLAWSQLQFPETQLATTINGENPDRTIQMSLSDTTGALTLSEHSAVFDAPPLEHSGASPACAVPDALTGLEWTVPPIDAVEIKSIESSPDGCHAIQYGTPNGNQSFFVCVPDGAMPFQVGESITAATFTPIGAIDTPETQGEGLKGAGLSIRSASYELLLLRGNGLVRHTMSAAPKLSTDPGVEAKESPSCEGAQNDCGELVIPLDFSFLGDHVSGVATGRAGAKIDFADNYGTLFIVRAESVPVRDGNCSLYPSGRSRIESALLIPLVP